MLSHGSVEVSFEGKNVESWLFSSALQYHAKGSMVFKAK
jgi:hypothetical protein